MVKDADQYDHHLQSLHDPEPEEDDDEDNQGSPSRHHIPEAGKYGKDVEVTHDHDGEDGEDG